MALTLEQCERQIKAGVAPLSVTLQCTWLLTEIDADGVAFGLCDLGMGEPEIGYVSLAELSTVRGKLGLPIERDLHFDADKTISAYAVDAATAATSSLDVPLMPPTFGSAAFSHSRHFFVPPTKIRPPAIALERRSPPTPCLGYP